MQRAPASLGALTPGSTAKERCIVRSGHRNGEQSAVRSNASGRLMQIDEKKLKSVWLERAPMTRTGTVDKRLEMVTEKITVTQGHM